jgi:large subunit ribosomal protein L30
MSVRSGSKRKPTRKTTPTRKAAKPRKPRKAAKPEKAKIEAAAPRAPRIEALPKAKVELRNLLIAVRIRGESAIPEKVEHTLDALRLRSKYNAVLLPDRAEVRGMLLAAKDMITWGAPSAETLTELIEHRAKTFGDKPLTREFLKSKLGLSDFDDIVERLASGSLDLKAIVEAGVKPVLRLHPPRGGFKLATHRLYQERGELGDRGRDIDLLLRKMI